MRKEKKAFKSKMSFSIRFLQFKFEHHGLEEMEVALNVAFVISQIVWEPILAHFSANSAVMRKLIAFHFF